MVVSVDRNAVRRGVVTLGIGLILGFAMVHLFGCGDNRIVLIPPDAPAPELRAPPIARGKCVADHYEGTLATKQVCLMDGYTWACGPANCDRTGEAVGERPPLVNAK